jgi:hypothetical protein
MSVSLSLGLGGGGGARECQNCAMDMKIREDFGASATDTVDDGRGAKGRRFWSSSSLKTVHVGNAVRVFAPVPRTLRLAAAEEIWPALEMKPVMLPELAMLAGGCEQERKRYRSRQDIVGSDSSWSASIFSLGSQGSESSNDGVNPGVMGWIKGLIGRG